MHFFFLLIITLTLLYKELFNFFLALVKLKNSLNCREYKANKLLKYKTAEWGQHFVIRLCKINPERMADFPSVVCTDLVWTGIIKIVINQESSDPNRTKIKVTKDQPYRFGGFFFLIPFKSFTLIIITNILKFIL